MTARRTAPSTEGSRPAFTLMEVVLAIALTAVVVYLLTTAIELYVFNVDASRTRVESAQLARTMLDQIADDLASTRLFAPNGQALRGFGAGTAPNGQGGSPSGPAGPGNAGTSGMGYSGGFGAGNSATMPSMAPTTVQGLFGTAQIIRVDRAARPNWERASRLVDPVETASKGDMPATVRYYLLDAQRMTTERLASEGVRDERSATNVAGLYRETIPTAAIPPEADPLATSTQVQHGTTVELLAPEVVAFAIAYFDGKQFVDQWDSVRAGGLPVGVEITITLAEPGFRSTPDAEEERRRAEGRYTANELVEYRRFVYLPLIEPGPPAQPLLPASGQNGQGSQGGVQNGNNNRSNNGADGGASNGETNAQFQTN